MPPTPQARRPKKLLIVFGVILLVLAFVPLPLSVSIRDKERAVAHALKSLLRDKRVLTVKGFTRLSDAKFMNDKTRIYFQNNLGIADTVFLEHGLKPVPNDRKLDVNNGERGVSFSHSTDSDKSSSIIKLAYVFGSLGAQGYEIKIYKSILMPYFVFTHDFTS